MTKLSWTYCKDRLPTAADASPDGQVWVAVKTGKSMVCNFRVAQQHDVYAWAPIATNAPPPIPDGITPLKEHDDARKKLIEDFNKKTTRLAVDTDGLAGLTIKKVDLDWGCDRLVLILEGREEEMVFVLDASVGYENDVEFEIADGDHVIERYAALRLGLITNEELIAHDKALDEQRKIEHKKRERADYERLKVMFAVEAENHERISDGCR